jgi:hypothetical protein
MQTDDHGEDRHHAGQHADGEPGDRTTGQPPRTG